MPSVFDTTQASLTFLRRAALALLLATGLLLVMLPMSDQPAGAQDDDVYRTCSHLGNVLASQNVGDANALKALGAPNPPGIDDALDVWTSPESTGDELAAAETTLFDYYGPICNNLDLCPLVMAIAGSDFPTAANAASLLRGITTPAPPGIDAALFVVAGGSPSDSFFYDSYAQAQQVAVNYFEFACDEPVSVTPPAGGDDGGEAPGAGDDGDQPTLAFTGPAETTRSLAMIGFGLIAAGAAAMAAIRSDRDRWDN